MESNVITIDGPTSSGKNSVGFLLSKKLGYQFIDTGMIYRVGTLLVLRKNVDPNDVLEVTETFKNLNIEIKPINGELKIFNNGEDLTDILHSKEITDNVSTVAAFREVREVTKIIQRNLGRSKNTVMSGRDIGSEIFPEARHKFFLTATVEVRAKRRFDQLVKLDPNIKYEDVLKSMLIRDKLDSEREVSPLRVPDEAITINNSSLSVEETVNKMLDYIHGHAQITDPK